MELHVGCAMWSYAAWQGRFLPHPHPPRERLRAYASWCNAVEGNTTFYATPARDTVASWAAQTGPGFRFILKLPKTVTHERRLGDVGEPMRAFLAAIEPLGTRAHALWVQLPPSFGPSGTPVLDGFLHRLPREYRYCVEVRHPAFFADPEAQRQLEQVLAGADAEWVDLDTTVLFAHPPASDAERGAQRQKPRLPRRSRALTGRPGGPLHRLRRQRAHGRGLAAVGRHGGGLAARGALADRLHPHAGQRRRARPRAPVPR